LQDLNEELAVEGSESNQLTMTREESLREAQRCKDYMLDGIEREIETSKSLKREYTKNMRVLMRMLLKSSSNVSSYKCFR